MLKGHNLDPTYEHTLDHHLEFFSKAGSLFEKGPRGRKSYAPYGGDAAETTALALFQPMWICPGVEAKTKSMKLLFWMRDCRGGAGARSPFRKCIEWLAGQKEGRAWLRANLHNIPVHGRFDDFTGLFKTDLEDDAARFWANALCKGDHYALKWAKCHIAPLQRALSTNEAGLRRLLRQPARRTIEQAVCENMDVCVKCGKKTHWMRVRDEKGEPVENQYRCSVCGTEREGPVSWADLFNYAHVPAYAMKRLSRKAFTRHDAEGFKKYKEALVKGETEIKASVLFPHDCLHTAKTGDTVIADQQFKALPNFMEGTDRRIMPLVDTSSSMHGAVAGGSVSRMDVSIALGLYCSDRLGKANPFYRKYMEFTSTPTFVDWQREPFHEACHNRGGWVGSTNIQAALDYILSMAQMFNATPEQMVNCLLILSDMQFDRHQSGRSPFGEVACEGTDAPVVERCMKKWEDAGYARPSIVFWNLAGYTGQPATCQTPNTALVSGFSPSILKSILGGEDFSPLAIMHRAIEKYDIVIPG